MESFLESCLDDITWRTGVEIGMVNILLCPNFVGKSLFNDKIRSILFGAFIINVEFSIVKLLFHWSPGKTP